MVGHQNRPIYRVAKEKESMNINIIGISGKKQSGKDTAASYLEQKYGYKVLHFASALKQIAYATRGMYVYVPEDVFPEYPDGAFLTYQFVIDRLGESAKVKVPGVRTILQTMGTDGVRDILGKNIWVDHIINKIDRIICNEPDTPGIVIPDTRFDNEAFALLKLGGFILNIYRDTENNSVDTHASEEGILPELITYNIQNKEGDKSHLYKELDSLMRSRK
jgi:hypothetical protein